MLRRHLGAPVFDNTAIQQHARCHIPMDHLGDHVADLCLKRYGWKYLHDALRDELGKGLFQTTDARIDYETRNLLPGLQARPVDVLVHPFPSVTGPDPPSQWPLMSLHPPPSNSAICI
eukprot:GFKZ01007447.1.p2 GENE.GFKZ01007447.1~~GFKZ01007447.1.p2  ORF type:complete len:118 (+),score=1.83 GFKZ01007447.1:1203-1556(+)